MLEIRGADGRNQAGAESERSQELMVGGVDGGRIQGGMDGLRTTQEMAMR